MLPRCYKPSDYGKVVSYELHNFSDASNIGYGVVSYLRIVNKEHIQCCLVQGKARVAPLKITTIPRMELTAATSYVLLSRKVIECLAIMIDKVYFWTYSMCFLRYIRNESTRFKTFVANRVNVIGEGSDMTQWNFVNSNNNPADIASRGLSMSDTARVNIWLHGPKFLWQARDSWPDVPEIGGSFGTDDPEIKRTATSANTTLQEQLPWELLCRYSSWLKLTRVVAWLLISINKFKCLVKKRRDQSILVSNVQHYRDQKSDVTQTNTLRDSRGVASMILSIEQMKKAEDVLIKCVQHEFFEEEISALTADQYKHIKKSSVLHKLDPKVLDGIL